MSIAAGALFAGGSAWLTRVQGLDMVNLTGDARGYRILAENILEHRSFTLSTSEPYAPESFRSPGYPAFISVLYALFSDWSAVLVAQMALVSVAPVLVYALFKAYSERAAWWGSIAFVFEPTRLFLSSSLLSDTLFTCLLLGSLVLLERGRRTSSTKVFFCAGLALGASILVRPIAMFLPLVYVLYIMAAGFSWRTVAAGSAVFVLAVNIVLLPWMARNHGLFGSWGLSSVGAANLVLYNAPAYLADHPREHGMRVLAEFNEQQSALPRSEALSLARAPVFTATFREALRGEEVPYLLFHVAKTVPFFVTDGLREIVRLYGIDLGSPLNISSALLSGNLRAVAAYAGANAWATLLLLAGSLFWALVTLLFFLAGGAQLVTSGPSRQRKLFVALILALALYFALLTGPVSNARYRLPVSGFMLVFAAGACVSFALWSAQARRRPEEA